MSFFTAVMASDGRGWRARDVDVEDVADLSDLADTLRAVSLRDQPVIAVIEREDEWFAVLRVDADEEVRGFVSDSEASVTGHYAELLAPVVEQGADVRATPDRPAPDGAASSRSQDGGAGDGSGDDAPGTTAEDDDAAPVAAAVLDAPRPWAGDPDLLADLGCDGGDLLDLVVDNPDDPATVLADVGERVGFGELLEALR